MADPTEEEIAAHCRAIQASYSPAKRRARQAASKLPRGMQPRPVALLVRLHSADWLAEFNDAARAQGVTQQALAHAALEAALRGEIKAPQPVRKLA